MQNSEDFLAPHMIAFVDVMGAKDILKDAERKKELFEFLLYVHKEEQKQGYVRPTEEQNGIEYSATITSFSDNIVISVPLCKALKNGPDWSGALHLIRIHISKLFQQALHHNFLIRGSVAVGELYHIDKMIFGQSLVNAYMGEIQAVYPRITLTDDCLTACKDYSPDDMPEEYFNNYLKFSESASYCNFFDLFVDYDGTKCVRLIDKFIENNKLPYLLNLRKHILQGIDSNSSNSYIKKNWVWLKSYIEREIDFFERRQSFSHSSSLPLLDQTPSNC